VGSDKATLADPRIQLPVVYPVVRQDNCTEGHDRLVANMDPTRVGPIELRGKRNLAVFAEVVIPTFYQVIAANFHHPGPHARSDN
jgi:hypothetical protein